MSTSPSSTPSTAQPWTTGLAHLGLTVRDLDASVDFFVSTLGYKKIGERPAYPAAFVSDGQVMLTLWQAKPPGGQTVDFDRHSNLGLHHVALSVQDARLEELHARLVRHPGCEVEFAPELAGGGPSRHMMVRIPGSGVRVEFRS